MNELDKLVKQITEEAAVYGNNLGHFSKEERQKQREQFIITRTILAIARVDSQINNPDHDEDDPECLNHGLLWHYDIKL